MKLAAACLVALTVGAMSLASPVATLKADSVSRVSRHAWPSLGMDKTIALGDALKKVDAGSRPKKITIYCGNPDCRSMMLDIDDALQIADWESDFEQGPVMVESFSGFIVGPQDSPLAKSVAAILSSTTGYPTELRETVDSGSVNIFIGKRP